MAEIRQGSVERVWSFVGGQEFLVPHLDAAPALFAPAVAVEADLAFGAPHLDASPALFAPAVAVEADLAFGVPFLDASPALHVPDMEVLQPVDLALPGGSLRFPLNNNETAISGFRGFLTQATPNMPLVLNSDGALFCVLRVPLDRTHDNRHYRIIGTGNPTFGKTFGLYYYGTDYNVSSLRGRFNGSVLGSSGASVNIQSPPLTETDVIVVFSRVGDDFSIDWYSLADGSKASGAVTSAPTALGVNGWRSNPFIIGGGDLVPSTSLARPYGYFCGDMQAVGYVSGPVLDATWQSIALGADIISTLGATNVPWLREFDGTSSTYGAPANATADVTAPCEGVDSVNLEVGSRIRRLDTSNYLTIDYFPDGKVFALQGGEAGRAVTFSGTAGGSLSGEVQLRLVYENGAVHHNWTTVAIAAQGTWAGSIYVHKSSDGWLIAQVRNSASTLPDAEMRERFGVGYKLGIIGQSQLEIAWTKTDRGDQFASANMLKMSVSIEREFQQVAHKRTLFRAGPHPSSDTAVAFINQWSLYGDDTPIQIVSFAEAGTGAISWETDSDTSRNWSDTTEIVNYVGPDFSALIWQWITNDTGFGANYGEVLDAVIKGVGPSAADHYLQDGLTFETGFDMILCPATRANTTFPGPFDVDANANYQFARKAQIDYFEALGWSVGPLLNDMQINPAGGPHQDQLAVNGNPLVGVRMAMAFARNVGFDTSSKPTIGNAVINGALNALTVVPVLPNGGSLQTAGGDAAVTGFEISADSGSTWSRSGFTAARVGNTVVLTKDSGAWPAEATQLRYHFGGPLSYGIAGPSESTLLAGVLYESYAPDALGLGLPVYGDGLGIIIS